MIAFKCWKFFIPGSASPTIKFSVRSCRLYRLFPFGGWPCIYLGFSLEHLLTQQFIHLEIGVQMKHDLKRVKQKTLFKYRKELLIYKWKNWNSLHISRHTLFKNRSTKTCYNLRHTAKILGIFPNWFRFLWIILSLQTRTRNYVGSYFMGRKNTTNYIIQFQFIVYILS